MRYLPSLTPLRGIAALFVVLLHLTRGDADQSVPAFLLRGYLGVDLFFILSGFVLTHIYVRDFLAGPSWRDIAAFLWARVARIYPVHVFILVVLILGGAAQGASAVALLQNFLLIMVPWPTVAINPLAWSLSAEWYAYLFFPFMVGWLWRCDGRLTAVVAIALLLWLDVFTAIRGFGVVRDLMLGRALPEFVIGVITYRAFSDRNLARHWQSDASFVAVAAALVVAVTLVPQGDVVVIALFPLLLLAAVSNAGAATRLLNARPLRWLGDISYSVYLGQVPAISVALILSTTWLGPRLGLAGLRVVALVATLAIATLVHRTIEVPCRDLLRRAPDQLRRLATRA